MRTRTTRTLLLAVLGLALPVFACAPRIQLSASGIGHHLEEERQLNQRALEQLAARQEARSETASSAEPAVTGESERPILPVTVLTPTPTPGELGEGVIGRQDLHSFLANGPHALLRVFWVEPDMEGDRFRGFRIEQVSRNGGALASCGLRVGDVVTAVNGQDISLPEGFMRVWDSMQQADHLHVDIIRRGQARSLRWTIQ